MKLLTCDKNVKQIRLFTPHDPMNSLTCDDGTAVAAEFFGGATGLDDQSIDAAADDDNFKSDFR